MKTKNKILIKISELRKNQIRYQEKGWNYDKNSNYGMAMKCFIKSTSLQGEINILKWVLK